MPTGTAHDALAMIEYRDQRSILILADSDTGATRARASIEQAGCRVIDAVAIEAAIARLDVQVATDAVWVELERDHGHTLDRLLERLDSLAKAGRHASVVSAPVELVEPIMARAGHSDIFHLCDASELERVAAAGLASAKRGSARLHDVRRGPEPPGLQQLSEEVGRIATILARLSEEEVGVAVPRDQDGAPEGGLESAEIRAVIRARRLRDQFFAAELFADPAWDMLLDLMAARLDRQRVAVSSLCIAAAVPATTALRWIKTLTDHGMFVRKADAKDGRRVFIELSDQAAAGMSAYFAAARRTGAMPI